MIHSSAPGKLVLLGEYVVLQGCQALVGAIDRRAQVHFAPSASETALLSAPELNLSSIPMSLTLHDDQWSSVIHGDASTCEKLALVKASFDASLRLHRELPDRLMGHWTFRTDAFFKGGHKVGLGSSAALAVAIVNAVEFALERTGMNDSRLFTTALKAHREFQQGSGSGIDIAASTFGGVCRYIQDRVPDPLVLPKDLHFGWVWVGESASTAPMVRTILAAVAKGGAAKREMEALAALTAAGIQALEGSDSKAFLDLVERFYQSFRALGDAAGLALVTKDHAIIHDEVIRLGGAYKPSGAGGGDIGLIMTHSKESLHEIFASIPHLGSYPCESIDWGEGPIACLEPSTSTKDSYP